MTRKFDTSLVTHDTQIFTPHAPLLFLVLLFLHLFYSLIFSFSFPFLLFSYNFSSCSHSPFHIVPPNDIDDIFSQIYSIGTEHLCISVEVSGVILAEASCAVESVTDLRGGKHVQKMHRLGLRLKFS
jgi:hypothetical protein